MISQLGEFTSLNWLSYEKRKCQEINLTHLLCWSTLIRLNFSTTLPQPFSKIRVRLSKTTKDQRVPLCHSSVRSTGKKLIYSTSFAEATTLAVKCLTGHFCDLEKDPSYLRLPVHLLSVRGLFLEPIYFVWTRRSLNILMQRQSKGHYCCETKAGGLALRLYIK